MTFAWLLAADSLLNVAILIVLLRAYKLGRATNALIVKLLMEGRL